jgi:predicted nucleic acid-binding protein
VTLILDTSVLFATIDRDDRDHARCRRLVEEADEPLLVPSPVLPEVGYLVQQRLGAGPLVVLLRDVVAGAYVVENLERSDYERAADLVDRYSDADIGFVDAAIFAVVERLGERKLATLDHRHFSVLRPRHVDALELVPEGPSNE